MLYSSSKIGSSVLTQQYSRILFSKLKRENTQNFYLKNGLSKYIGILELCMMMYDRIPSGILSQILSFTIGCFQTDGHKIRFHSIYLKFSKRCRHGHSFLSVLKLPMTFMKKPIPFPMI